MIKISGKNQYKKCKQIFLEKNNKSSSNDNTKLLKLQKKKKIQTYFNILRNKIACAEILKVSLSIPQLKPPLDLGPANFKNKTKRN